MDSLKFFNKKLLVFCLSGLVIAVIANRVFKIPLGNLFFYSIIAACPLMHIIMMKSHGHGNQQKTDTKKRGKSSR